MAAHECQLRQQSDFNHDGKIELVPRRGSSITLLKKYAEQ
jgi:hypothetical protein